MLKENLIIWNKLQMKYWEMDIWKDNEYSVLNEEVKDFTNS